MLIGLIAPLLLLSSLALALTPEMERLQNDLNKMPTPPDKCQVLDEEKDDYDNVAVLFEGCGGHNEKLDVVFRKIMAQKPKCESELSPDKSEFRQVIKFKDGSVHSTDTIKFFLNHMGLENGLASPPGLKNFVFRQMCENYLLNLERTKVLYFQEFQDVKEAAKCLKAVKEKLPHTKTIIEGFSMGGHKAIEFANHIHARGMRIDLGITVDPVIQGVSLIKKMLIPEALYPEVDCKEDEGYPSHDPLSPDEFRTPEKVKWLNFWQESDTRLMGKGLRGFGVNNATYNEKIGLTRDGDAHWKIFENDYFEELLGKKFKEMLGTPP